MRYQSKQPKRQFLAGVICRTCQRMDTIVQIQSFEPADEYIECIECGKRERRPTQDDLQQQSAPIGIITLK